ALIKSTQVTESASQREIGDGDQFLVIVLPRSEVANCEQKAPISSRKIGIKSDRRSEGNRDFEQFGQHAAPPSSKDGVEARKRQTCRNIKSETQAKSMSKGNNSANA